MTNIAKLRKCPKRGPCSDLSRSVMQVMASHFEIPSAMRTGPFEVGNGRWLHIFSLQDLQGHGSVVLQSRSTVYDISKTVGLLLVRWCHSDL